MSIQQQQQSLTSDMVLYLALTANVTAYTNTEISLDPAGATVIDHERLQGNSMQTLNKSIHFGSFNSH